MKKWMILTAALAAGCAADTEPAPGDGAPIVLTEESAEVTAGKADVYATKTHLVPLRQPVKFGCAESAMIETLDLANTEVGQPIITETFGPDGCIDERWVREWDGERPLSEFYDFFDPELGRYAYVDPFSYTHEWSYDAQGRETLQTRTLSGEEQAFYIESTAYDAAGNVVERTRQNNAMAPNLGTQTRETWRFDAAGRVVEHLTYYEGDVSERREYVYDADGNEVEYRRHYRDAIQEERHQTYTDGLLTARTVWGLDGELVTETTVERRADGTKLRERSMNHRNGWLDIHEFDAAERETLYTQDSNRDGNLDYRKVWRYDADGNLVFSSTEYDFRPNGVAARYSDVRNKYDEQGRLTVTTSTPVWLDGLSQRSTFQYDGTGEGYVVTRERLNGDTVLTTEAVTRFADPDRVLWSRNDGDRDGYLESLTVNRWDGPRQLESLTDHDDDGSVDSVEQWAYDLAGQLVEHRVDDDGDGIVDSRETYQR